jgi:hypothetical protein
MKHPELRAELLAMAAEDQRIQSDLAGGSRD